MNEMTIEMQDEMIAQIEDAQRSTARDILDTLRDFLTDAPADERAGMLAAIEIIENNHSH
jgi:hypothetical protein